MYTEINESEVSDLNLYLREEYPHKGLFLNKAESGGYHLLFVTDAVFWVNHFDTYPNFLEAKREKEKGEPKENSVSQELFLKTLSLLTNKEESYKN